MIAPWWPGLLGPIVSDFPFQESGLTGSPGLTSSFSVSFPSCSYSSTSPTGPPSTSGAGAAARRAPRRPRGRTGTVLIGLSVARLHYRNDNPQSLRPYFDVGPSQLGEILEKVFQTFSKSYQSFPPQIRNIQLLKSYVYKVTPVSVYCSSVIIFSWIKIYFIVVKILPTEKWKCH